jgi:hypothetical protein
VVRYLRERVRTKSEEKHGLAGGGLLFKMRGPANVGLLRFVLQYGAEADAIQPDVLRQGALGEARRVLEASSRRGLAEPSE